MPYIVGSNVSSLSLTAGVVNSGVTTTSSTGEAVLIEVSSNHYRSVNFQIQAIRGTNYNTTNIQVLHDGSQTYMSEYGTINQPTGISTFSTDISSNKIRLLSYPSTSDLTTFNVIYTAQKT